MGWICEVLTKESEMVAVVVGWILGLFSALGAALVSEKKRAALVQILSYIDILNGKIDDMTYWDRLTFDLGKDDNYALAVQNSEGSKDAIFSACKRIGNLIDQI